MSNIPIKSSLIILITLFLFSSNSFAQWLPTGTATNDAKYRSGSIGIGMTSAPLTGTTLQLYSYSSPVMRFSNGTSSANALLGSVIGRGNGYGYDATKIDMNIEDAWQGGNYSSRISFWTTGNNGTLAERMRLTKNGNLLINKTVQANIEYKIDVNGKIRVNEVVVNTTGADFVFDDNYQLKSISEVESFIKENKHLPEIPNAEEMQQNGMSLSEMNTKLLQKVEELTLYIIEQNKQLKDLQKDFTVFKEKVK